MGFSGKHKAQFFFLIKHGVQAFHPHLGPHRKIPVAHALTQFQRHGIAADLHCGTASKAGQFHPNAAFDPHGFVQKEILVMFSIQRQRKHNLSRFRSQPNRCHRFISAHRTAGQIHAVVIGFCRQASAICQNGTKSEKALRIQMTDHPKSPLKNTIAPPKR